MSYYDREKLVHLDGTPIFQTPEDRAAEQEIADFCAKRWGCKIDHFGELAPLDWFATREERLVGVLELKRRDHPAVQWPTVFLNIRKWLALYLAQIGLGVPAIYVVRFTDSIRYIGVASFAVTSVSMGGGVRRNAGRSDREPMVNVPIADMTELGK